MAEDINFGTLTDRLNFHFGPNQVQKIDQGGTTVWVNNQAPVISITGPIVGTPGANNTDIQVTAGASQVIAFTYSDSDAADTVSTITVADPNGGNVNVSGFSAGLNSGTCNFTIASSWFPTIGPVTSNNVFTITATDNRGGVATSTVTVTAAAFNGPTISASNNTVTHPSNASSTGTIPSPASGVFSKVSTTSTGLGFGNPALTSNTLSAVQSNGTCGTSVSRTFYAASYDTNSNTWSGISTKTVTLTVSGLGPYNATPSSFVNQFIGGGSGSVSSASYNYNSGLSVFQWDGDCAGTTVSGFTARAYITPAAGYAWKANTDFSYATIARNNTSRTDTSIPNPGSLTAGVDINWSNFYTTSPGMANFFSGVTPANASSQVPVMTIYSALSSSGASPGRVWQNGNTTFSGTSGVQFSWTIPYTSPGGFTLGDGPSYSSAPGLGSGGGTSSSNYPSLHALNSSLNAINLTFPSSGTYVYTHSASGSFIGISAGGAGTGAILVPGSHASTLTFNIAAPGPSNATTGNIDNSFAGTKVYTAQSSTFALTANGIWNTVTTGTGMTAGHSGTTNATKSWSLTENPNQTTRTGTIKLYAGSTQSTLLDTKTWTQAGAPATPTGNIDNTFASPKVHTAQSGTFGVTANGAWNTVATGTGMTATNSGTTSQNGNSWSLSANITGSTRTGTIKLYSGSTQSTELDSVTWTQEAAPPVSPPSLSQMGLDYDKNGNDFSGSTFTVTSSVSYTVSDNQSWITTSQSGNTITVYCAYNPSLSTRTGVVTVTNSGGSATVNIRQFGYN
jgi:hypothetical protein